MIGRAIAWSAIALWLKRLWRISTWFKPVVIAAVLIAAVFFMHTEYLDYVDATTDREHVLLSFIVKWGLVTLIGFATLGAIGLRGKKRQSKVAAEESPPAITESEASSSPSGVDFDNPRSAAERILNEKPR